MTNSITSGGGGSIEKRGLSSVQIEFSTTLLTGVMPSPYGKGGEVEARVVGTDAGSIYIETRNPATNEMGITGMIGKLTDLFDIITKRKIRLTIPPDDVPILLPPPK